jgi:hypothetical protein
VGKSLSQGYHLPAQAVAERLGKLEGPATVYLAAAEPVRLLEARLTIRYRPHPVEIKYLLPPFTSAAGDTMLLEESSNAAKKVYAWRRNRDIVFYPTLEILLHAIRNAPPEPTQLETRADKKRLE